MALIDPLTAFAAIKTGISLVERGIKAGKELHELASPIMKWASNEAHLETHSARKGNTGFLGKFTGVEQDAIAAFIRKQEIEKKRAELREIFLLYVDDGLNKWEQLQKEIAHQRALNKQRIKEQIARKKRFRNTLIILCSVGLAVTILLIEIYYLMRVK